MKNKHKINKDRLESVGYGEEEPLSSDKSPKGRAINRRIEWVIISGNENKNIDVAK